MKAKAVSLAAAIGLALSFASVGKAAPEPTADEIAKEAISEIEADKPAPVPPPVIAPDIVAPAPPAPFTVAPSLKTNDISVSADGRSIQLVGQISDGIALRLSAELKKNKDVKTLILTSDGGLLTEGVALAHLVRKFALNTHVEFLCGSACTFPLIAGKERSIAPGAVVGFHQASMGPSPFLNPATITGDDAGNQLMKASYAQSGMGAEMIDRALATGPETMWFPDMAALQANNVISRVAKPGEFAATVPGWKSMQEYSAELAKDPLWAAARAAKPQHFGYAAGAGWLAASKYGDRAGSLRFARATLVRRILSDAPAYPDALLLEFAATEQKIWADTAAVYNRECTYGPGLRFPVGEAKETLREPQLALLKKMLALPSVPESADGTAARAAAQAQVMQFWGRMIAEQGFSAYMVSSNFCREPLTYFEEMAKMPAGERAKLLRGLILLNGMSLR